MHYRNGREAKAGDRILDLKTRTAGILYDPNPTTNTCNGRVAVERPHDVYVNIGDCIHLDDVREAFPAPPPSPPPPAGK